MSTHCHKVEYTCECGINYGSCGAKCAFIVRSHHTCDVYAIFHVDTHYYRGFSEEKPEISRYNGFSFGDEALCALQKALECNPEDEHKLTDKEKEVIIEKWS